MIVVVAREMEQGIESIVFHASVLKKLENVLQINFAPRKFTYTFRKASQKGDNYLGLVYRVLAKSLGAAVELTKTMRIIVKVPPDNPFRRKQFFARPSFLREALAYDKFLETIRRFQEEKELPSSEMFVAYPKCYGTLIEDQREAIFLEDMCEKGYRLFDRFQELPFEQVSLVMREYGKLHAVSFALKQQIPQNLMPFQNLTDILAQRDDEQILIYYEELKKRALASLTEKDDEKYHRQLDSFFQKQNFHNLLMLLVNGEYAEPYAVVCHGDCWINNFLFQYEHEKPVNVCLLDWQIMRYASPITDIMYFLYTSTSRNFREQHYQEVLNIYYDALCTHMQRLACEAEYIFSRETFDKQLKNYGASGLLFAMIVLPLVTTRPDDVPDLNELGELIESGGNISDLKDNSSFLDGGQSNLYNTRMRDVVIDMIDKNYI